MAVLSAAQRREILRFRGIYGAASARSVKTKFTVWAQNCRSPRLHIEKNRITALSVRFLWVAHSSLQAQRMLPVSALVLMPTPPSSVFRTCSES